ncbi:polysaccharide biosynthesis tyrosine autokinase [Hymenobacter glaciei]|uniref:Polysaccharide biosynthesis tyrosine autokinase n=1 Tax=Hymenobacter glaciei TaxID=877209 RepID=A0ABP7TP76_9BACT
MQYSEAPSAQPSQSGTINIAEIFSRYTRYWYLFVLGVLACLLLAFLFLRYTTPKYEITSKLLIRDIDKSSNFLSGNPAFKELDIFNSTASIEDEIESLKSNRLMQRTLNELSLTATYFVPRRVKNKELYGKDLHLRVLLRELSPAANATGDKNLLKIFVKDSSTYELEDKATGRSVHQFGQEVTKPYGVFTILNTGGASPKDSLIIIKLHRLRDLADEYGRNMTVEPVNKKTNVLLITLLDAVPEKGKDIVTKLIAVYNLENQEDHNSLAINTVQFIDNRLRDLSGELSSVEHRVENYKSRKGVTNVSSEAAGYEEQAKGYNKQLSDIAIQLDVLASLGRYLTPQAGQYNLVPSNLGLQDPTLVALISKFNELALERERMLRTTRVDNPLVINLNDQLTNLRGNILENLRNIKRGLELTRNTLASRSGQFESSVRQVPTIERELLEISRQQSVKQSLYQYLLQKREESALSVAATASNTRLIDPSLASREPVKPPKPIVYALALLAGLLLPFAFISVRGLTSSVVENRTAVERTTSTPIVGQIGHLRKGQSIVVSDTSASPEAENFHFLRSNLLLHLREQPSQVIGIGSGVADEGKTLVALNLAASLGQAGRKVVVLDFNLRQPHVASYLDKPADAAGLTNYLSNNSQPLEGLVHSAGLGANVDLLGAGPAVAVPTSLLGSPRVAQLLTALRQQYDHIIVVTAPLGTVADTYSLGSHLDAFLYVVRLRRSRFEHLRLIEEVRQQGKLPTPLLVLNDGRA